MICENGGRCTQRDDIPTCKCPSSRYVGTRCEIDLAKLHFDNQTALKIAALDYNNHQCDILGNDATPMHHAIAIIILFFILLLIFAFTYFFFYMRMKRTKRFKF
jgi:hypothetical protein